MENILNGNIWKIFIFIVFFNYFLWYLKIIIFFNYPWSTIWFDKVILAIEIVLADVGSSKENLKVESEVNEKWVFIMHLVRSLVNCTIVCIPHYLKQRDRSAQIFSGILGRSKIGTRRQLLTEWWMYYNYKMIWKSHAREFRLPNDLSF